MSGDSASEHPPTNGSKRRRATTGDVDAPAAKKSYTDAEIATEVALSLHIREQRREEVRAIYLNYGNLLKGGENGNEALAFQGLLDCANGSLGARRLAARLVPRFLARFPNHSEQAFRLLATLYGAGHPADETQACPNCKDGPYATHQPRAGLCGATGDAAAATSIDGPDEAAGLERAMRRDALAGMGNVLEAAVRQADRHVPLVMEVVAFLMRHLRRLSAIGGSASATGTGVGVCDVTAAAGPCTKTPAADVQPQPQPEPQPEPQPQPQPQAQPQPTTQPAENSAASYGHGLKHRYRSRAADAAAAAAAAAACADANGSSGAAVGRGRSLSLGPANDEGAGGRGSGGARAPRPSSQAGLVSPGLDVSGPAGTRGVACKFTGASAALDPGAAADYGTDTTVIRSLLGRAFCLFPRVVLAACFQPYRLPPKQRASEDCCAADLLLGLLLLGGQRAAVPAMEPAQMDGMDAGGCGAAAGCGGAGSREERSDVAGGRAASVDAAGGGAAAGHEPIPVEGPDVEVGSCLAARVLKHLPETQNWLRQLAAAMIRGKNPQPLPDAVRAQLDRLLQFCTAVVPTVAAGGGGGKVSPKASPGGAPTVAAAAAVGAAPGPTGAVGASIASPSPRQPAIKAECGGSAAATATATTTSMLGSEDNSRSVPMDLDHSISTAVRPEGSTGAAAAAVGPAGAGGGAAALPSGPSDTATTPAPPPPPPPLPPLPQHPYPLQQLDTTSTQGPASPVAAATPPPLPPPLPSFPSVVVGPSAAAGGPSSSSSSGLRGGLVCRAEACLFIGGLPSGLTEAVLVSELSRCGAVESVHTCDPQQHQQQHAHHHHHAHGGGGGVIGSHLPAGDEVYVVFVSLRDAAICYEAIARTCCFGGTRPLAVEFCSAFPPDSPAARRSAAASGGTGGSEFVWVSLSVGAGVTPEMVVATLQAAALPVPQQILQVAGRAPGMLLHMSSSAAVPQVTTCLQAHFTPPLLPLPPPVPAAVAGAAAAQLPPPPPPQVAGGAMPYGSSAPPGGAHVVLASGPGVPYGAPLHMQQGIATGPDPPPLNCRTIWVGQLHEAVRDEELLSACRLHGAEVVGYRFLRGSHCAFVDFASQAGAEAAKRALHGTRLGPQHIRVEWKLDSGPPPRALQSLRHSAPVPGTAGVGPGGGSMYGVAPGLAPAGPQGLGQHGAAATAAAMPGLAQPLSAPAGMTPQALAAANVAAAAAAAAARGTFPGSRSGADRWAPVAIPPAAAVQAHSVGGAIGAAALASAGSGFLAASGQQPSMPTQPATAPPPPPPPPLSHLQVGPFGAPILNPAVAAAARQAVPRILAHQQMTSGAGVGGGASQTFSQPHQQQPHITSMPPAGVGSGGGTLPHGQGHLHSSGGYPGPPPQQQHISAPPPLPGHHPSHQPHALGSSGGGGGPSPIHVQLSAPQPPHAQNFTQPPPLRAAAEWQQQHGHGHGLGIGPSAASPGMASRFEPVPGTAQPAATPPQRLHSSPTPPPPDALAAAAAAAAGAAPHPPLHPQAQHPHAHSHQHLQLPLPHPQPLVQQPVPPPPHQQQQQQLSHPHHHQQHHHHPQPPPPQQQQGPPSGAGGAPSVVTWQGGLAKSGMHMCTLQCTSGGASVASGATAGEREPVTWPATLDVKLRVDLSYVVHSLYSHTAPHARAMRRLVTAGGPEQRNKLAEFLSYLADKNRAGVIKLEAAAGLPPRTLYLVPPSEQVCAALGAEWSLRGEPFLLALVVPTAGGGAAGGNKG